MKEFFATLEFMPFSAFCLVLMIIVGAFHFFGIINNDLLIAYFLLIFVLYGIGLGFIFVREYRKWRDSEILDEDEESILLYEDK